MRTFLTVDDLWRDVRHAVRGLRRAPIHSASIVTLLALAIGANVAIFSLVNALLLRELPVDRPGDLVAVKRMSRGTSQGMSMSLFEAVRQRVTTVDLIAIADVSAPLADAAAAADVTDATGVMVTGNYFQVLRAGATLGRLIGEDDDRFADPRPVMVLSHALWTRRFGGDRAVVGRSVLLAGHRFTIVGVAAKELRALGGDRGIGADYWIPLNMQPVVSGGADRRRNPGASMLRVMGRRREGASIQQVQAEFDVLYRQLPAPVARPESTLQALAGSRGFGEALAAQYWPSLRVLMAGVALLLVMACANIASLLLARAGKRQQEIAVRQALGSGRPRLIRQLLVEHLVLAAAGGMLGLAWASAGARILVALAVPAGTPALDLSIDRTVLLFTTVVVIAATVLFGLAPALQLSQRRLESALRAGTRGATARSRHALNRALVASQAALAVILVVGAVQFARSLYRLYAADLGFDRRHVVIATVDGRPAGYQTEAQFAELARQIVDRLSSLPGVESATVAATGFLGGGRRSTRSYTVDGHRYGAPGDPPLYVNEVSNDYLRAFRVPVRGRAGLRCARSRRRPARRGRQRSVRAAVRAGPGRDWPSICARRRRARRHRDRRRRRQLDAERPARGCRTAGVSAVRAVSGAVQSCSRPGAR